MLCSAPKCRSGACVGLLAGLWALLTACAAPNRPGQDPGPLPGQLRGVVLDSLTGIPLEGVLLVLENGNRTTSDERGAFRFPAPVRGGGSLTLVDRRCHVRTVSLSWEGITELPLVLRTPYVTLYEEPLPSSDRRKRITAERIREMHPGSIMDAIRSVAPEMVARPESRPGMGTAFIAVGAPSLFGPTRPMVIVDGMQLGEEAASTLQDISPEDVALLEIIPAGSAGWRFGTNASAGVIRVTTLRGVPSGLSEGDPERCPVELPGRGDA